MTYEIKYEHTHEGVIAYVSGSIAPFSFLIGNGDFRSAEFRGSYLWSLPSTNCKYILQLILLDASEYILQSQLSTEDILLTHMQWECEHQERQLGCRIVEGSLSVGNFPTGELFLTWLMEWNSAETVEHQKAWDLVGTSSEIGQGEITLANGYSAYATTLHSAHIIGYSVQGFGEGWTKEKLQLKGLRVMLSTFRHG